MNGQKPGSGGAGGNGGGQAPSAADCKCSVCSVCGGCTDLEILKSFKDNGEDGGAMINCPVCSCPEVLDNDPTFVGTKAECVYLKLKNSKMMDKLLEKFVGSKRYDISYKVVDNLIGIYTGGQAYGKIENKDGRMTIFINSYFFDKNTPVLIAKTLLHETVHAHIYQEVSAMGGLDKLENSNFENLFAYYKAYGALDYQHDYMSKYYISDMAQTLMEFDNFAYDKSYYKALSWHGLHDSYGWIKMTAAERTIIKNKTSVLNSGNKICK